MKSQTLFLTNDCSEKECFGLDPLNRKICSENGSIRLRPKLWNVLLILLENENQLIERESLIELVWNGNHFTGPQGVSHSICVLRGMIADLELPLIIITLPKRGYILQRARIRSTQPTVSEFDVIKYDQSYG